MHEPRGAVEAREEGERFRPGWGLALLILFVFVSRLLYLTTSTNGPESAHAILRTGSVLFNGQAEPESFVAGQPLYVALCAALAGAMRAVGFEDNLLRTAVLASIVSMASALVPLYWLASALLRSRAGGLASAGFYAIVPATWWFSGEATGDTMGVAFLLWAFGWLARWWGGGAPWNLGIGCLVLGSAVLVKFQTVLFLPLFLLVVVAGLVRRGGRRAAAMTAVLVVPMLATLGLQVWQDPGRGLTAFFSGLGPKALLGERLTPVAHGREVLFMVRMALGDVALAAVGAGIAGLLVFRPRAFLAIVLWTAPLVGLQAFLERTLVRAYLPLMPAAALALAGLVLALVRIRRTRPVVVFSTAVLAVVVMDYARRDLETLHTRVNVLDAIPAWYRRHTPERSLLVGGKDTHHLRAFGGGRKVVEFLDRFARGPHWEIRVQTPPAVLERIDEAMLDGYRVFVHDWINPVVLRALGSHFALAPFGMLEGKNLRNLRDHEFGWMGEGLKITRDVHFYELHMKTRWPRAAPAPWPWVDRREAVPKLNVGIDCPAEPGAAVRVWLSRRQEALDWTEPGFGRDPLLQRTAGARPEPEVVLDAEGRAEVEIDPDLTEALKGLARVFVAYAVLDPAGEIRRISVARPLAVDW